MMNFREIKITYFVIVCSLFCAVALENSTHEDVRKIARSGNKLPSEDVQLQNVQNGKSDIPQRKWITQLFLEAEISFQMDPKVNAACKKDFDLYKLHLRNQSVWAVRMMESSEWPSVGIFSGMVTHLGNFDECLAVSAHDVKGQYCLPEVIYNYPDTLQNEAVDVPDQSISAWEALLMYQQNPVRVDRKKLNFAICVPSSCEPTDLKISLNSTLYPVFKNHGLYVSVDVDPIFCKMKKEPTYSQEFFIAGCFFVVLFLLVMSSTFYDIVKQMNAGKYEIKAGEPSNNLSSEVFQAFSIIKNVKKLLKVNPKTDYPFMHAMKIFHMVAIIYEHRAMFLAGFPKFNAEADEQQYSNYSTVELVHSFIPDVFFMLSGFLTFNFGLVPMMKGGVFYLILSIVFRWIRMIPVFGILLLYVVHIFPYTSEGPMWDYRIMDEVAQCKESWWANLLVINNIVRADHQCLLASWYISVDIQLAIIGGILLFIFAKNKKIGIFAIISVLIASTVVTFIVAYTNKFHGILRLFVSFLEKPRNEEEYFNFYIATYTRAGPYLLGFLIAIAVKLMKEREREFSNKQIYLFLFLSLLVSEGCSFYAFVFYAFNRPYNRLENALYASLNRLICTSFSAVMICLYFTSGLGVFTKFMELKIWVPFGRLTYLVFLVNIVIQLYYTASQKQLMPMYTKLNLIWLSQGDITCSYIVALVLHLIAEAPITNLSKLLQRQLLKSLVKPKSNECIGKADSSAKPNETKNDEISDIVSNRNIPLHDYHNDSCTNNEAVSKISYLSKF